MLEARIQALEAAIEEISPRVPAEDAEKVLSPGMSDHARMCGRMVMAARDVIHQLHRYVETKKSADAAYHRTMEPGGRKNAVIDEWQCLLDSSRERWYELTSALDKYEELADLRQHICYEELYGERERREEEKKPKFVKPDPVLRDTIQ